MTAKERRELERMKIRIEELEKQLYQSRRVGNELIRESVNLNCTVRAINELLQEAAEIIKTGGAQQ